MIIPYEITIETAEQEFVNIGSVVGRSRIPVAIGGKSVVGQDIVLDIEETVQTVALEVGHPITF